MDNSLSIANATATSLCVLALIAALATALNALIIWSGGGG